MDTSAINNKISHLTFPSPHRKYLHHNKIISFTPFMSLKPSAHKVLEVTNVPKITSYHDTWLDLMAINHLSQNLQAVAGIQIEEKGYDGLLETCKEVTVKFDPVQQRKLSLEGLARSIPKEIFPLLRALVPHCKFTRELLAKFTGLFFSWLVGPSELKESEYKGTTEKNVVHVKKCRFLESSNCVGMCTNLCKFPTQTFIKDSLGMPINMVPNFEDMSCDMIFGEEPPAQDKDPVTKQSCYKLCKMTKIYHFSEKSEHYPS
ncbi:beta-carotene isomerase D27, chloroplastic-like [Chenopodium quinoa]|uniref:beta-carotene isomerase D27, chloroplastic-like n=1 Tax=Chenopodium quinoa TaxID=63459 RepID=UPI000B77F658|nr:beta-carotene isomerase D27, chloroplastic-like [Chenopodium quinoa]